MRVRLTPSASVTPTGTGVILRSDLGTFQLDGDDVGEFVDEVMPLLDGSRDREGVAAALPAYSASSTLALLDALESHGLLEEVQPSADEGGPARLRGQEDFLRRWRDGDSGSADRLKTSRVVVVGLEPWGATAALELAAAGVGELVLVDENPVSDGDVLGARAWAPGHVGASRAAALAAALADRFPDCAATTGSLEGLRSGVRLPDGSEPALVVAALARDDLVTHHALARACHAAGVRSLYSYLDGLDAVVGPGVAPGETACWNCWRLRALAHADDPHAAHALQHALLEAPPAARRHTYLAPMAPLLGQLVALESLKLLTGYTTSRLMGRLLVQSLVTLESAYHAVVRMPWCEVCGGASAGGASTGGATGARSHDERAGSTPLDPATIDDPAELRDRLAGWVDDRTGVIRQLASRPGEAPGPELPITATAVMSRYTDGHHHEHETTLGSGKGMTRVEAMLGAAGEAIERYSAARYSPADLRRASRVDLAGSVLAPAELCLYADEQYARDDFPFAPYDDDAAIDWTAGHWLEDGTPVTVPALPTYFNYRAPPEERFCQVTSNGLAAGSSVDDASARAICELIERDAFMLTWLARLPARRLVVDAALDAGAAEVLRELSALGVDVRLALLDAPLPTVVCVGFGDGERWPGATVALATHPDGRVAVRKAILEHGHVGPYIRRLMREEERAVPDVATAVRTLEDHAMYYVPAERRAAFDFMLGGDEVALSELERADGTPLEVCRRKLREAELEVALADVTAPDVQGSPFRVVRALGRWVQQIHFGSGLERLASPRLAAALGGRGLNPDPHPLA